MKKLPRFAPLIQKKVRHAWPIDDYFDHVALWATRATARSREREMDLPPPSPDIDARVRAAMEVLMMLSDPNVRGSHEMLLAIIEERRRKMN